MLMSKVHEVIIAACRSTQGSAGVFVIALFTPNRTMLDCPVEIRTRHVVSRVLDGKRNNGQVDVAYH